MLVLSEGPEILLRSHAVGALPLPAKSLLPEAALTALTAIALLLLQQLGNDRQDLAHDLVDVLRRQRPLIIAVAAAEGRHRLLHLILLLRLSDDLRQDWRDLLQDVADFLLGELALAAPGLAKGGVLAKGALPVTALPKLTLAKSPAEFAAGPARVAATRRRPAAKSAAGNSGKRSAAMFRNAS